MTLDEALLPAVEHARTELLDREHETERARVDFHHGLRRLHAAGGSLREIAEHFGLSHQRVHQIVDTGAGAGRKNPLVERIVDRVRDWGGFTRFTQEARAVVVRAQDEAGRLGHEQIGTEHVLLGLLRGDDDPGAAVLRALGVELEAARARIVRAVGSSEARSSGKHLRFTPRAKKVLERSLREALALRHNHIGTEHILLGLVRESSGLAARVLRDLGAEPGHVRAETERALAAA